MKFSVTSVLVLFALSAVGSDAQAGRDLAKPDSDLPASAYVSESATLEEESGRQLQTVDLVSTANNSIPPATTFTSLVRTAGLEMALRNGGPFTVFAGSDASLANQKQRLQTNPSISQILRMHIVNGVYRTSDLKNGMKLQSLQGFQVPVRVDSTGIYVDDNRVVASNQEASNGILHVINGLILPPPTPAPAGPSMPSNTARPRPSSIPTPRPTRRPTTRAPGSTAKPATRPPLSNGGSACASTAEAKKWPCNFTNDSNVKGYVICRSNLSLCIRYGFRTLETDGCGCCPGDTTSVACRNIVQATSETLGPETSGPETVSP